MCAPDVVPLFHAGTKSRTVTCVRIDDGSDDEEKIRDCLKYFDMPDTSMACFDKPCAEYVSNSSSALHARGWPCM